MSFPRETYLNYVSLCKICVLWCAKTSNIDSTRWFIAWIHSMGVFLRVLFRYTFRYLGQIFSVKFLPNIFKTLFEQTLQLISKLIVIWLKDFQIYRYTFPDKLSSIDPLLPTRSNNFFHRNDKLLNADWGWLKASANSLAQLKKNQKQQKKKYRQI